MLFLNPVVLGNLDYLQTFMGLIVAGQKQLSSTIGQVATQWSFCGYQEVLIIIGCHIGFDTQLFATVAAAKAMTSAALIQQLVAGWLVLAIAIISLWTTNPFYTAVMLSNERQSMRFYKKCSLFMSSYASFFTDNLMVGKAIHFMMSSIA